MHVRDGVGMLMHCREQAHGNPSPCTLEKATCWRKLDAGGSYTLEEDTRWRKLHHLPCKKEKTSVTFHTLTTQIDPVVIVCQCLKRFTHNSSAVFDIVTKPGVI